MCAHEVHTYNNRNETMLYSGNILIINTYIRVLWNDN